MAPFAFFVGCGRSGTTLVQVMFDAHPRLAVVHEARFVADLGRRARQYGAGEAFATARFAADVAASPNYRHLKMPVEDLHRAVGEPEPTSYPDAVRRVFTHYARRCGKERYGDKTPAYVVQIPLLARLFPEARFVHIIRDGRSSALSYLARSRGPRDLAGNAYNWRSRVSRGRAAGRALGPARYREVRYEDLVNDPEAALRPLCEFLDLHFDEQMLRYHERADEVLSAVTNPDRFEHVARPPAKGLRDWRQEMSPPDIALFEAIAGDLLDDLGYELRTHTPAAHRLVGVTGAWLSWQQQRAMAGTRSARRRLRSTGASGR